MKTKKNLTLLFITNLLLMTLAACGILPEAEATQAVPLVVVDNSIINATGILTPETYAVLSLSVAGSVDQVLVSEGQKVAPGQLLISLSNPAQAEAILAAAAYELQAAQQAMDDLNETAASQKATAWLAWLDAKTQYLAAEEQWETLDKDALQDDINDAEEDIIEAREDLETAQENFDRYADLEEDRPLRVRYQDELDEAQETYNETLRARDRLVIESERAEANWKVALEGLNLAQADYEATLDGPDPDLLDLVQARLENAKAQIRAAQEHIDKNTLTAPFAGTVADLKIRTGEWAAPGQPILVLADLNTLRVETTDLNEIDLVRIEVGALADVTFDALPDQVFEGTVIEIAPKASEGSGVNYTVVIDLAEVPLAARWGMTAFVDIHTNQ